MQPSAATSRARVMYCCWVPPHPWMNSTPGISAPGVTTVPAMYWSPTAISSGLSRVADIELDRVLRQGAGSWIDAAEIHECIRRYRAGIVVDLDRRAADVHPRGIAAECIER